MWCVHLVWLILLLNLCYLKVTVLVYNLNYGVMTTLLLKVYEYHGELVCGAPGVCRTMSQLHITNNQRYYPIHYMTQLC